MESTRALAADADHVAEREDVGRPGSVRSGATTTGPHGPARRPMPPRAREASGGRRPRLRPRRRCAPEMRVRVPAASCEVDRRPASTPTTVVARASASRRATRAQLLLGLLRGAARGNSASTRSVASTSRTRVARGIDRAVLAPKRVDSELGDLPGHLDTRRPGADDHERQPRPACARLPAPPRPPRMRAGSGRAGRARPRATSAPARTAPHSSFPKYE